MGMDVSAFPYYIIDKKCFLRIGLIQSTSELDVLECSGKAFNDLKYLYSVMGFECNWLHMIMAYRGKSRPWWNIKILNWCLAKNFNIYIWEGKKGHGKSFKSNNQYRRRVDVAKNHYFTKSFALFMVRFLTGEASGLFLWHAKWSLHCAYDDFGSLLMLMKFVESKWAS